MRLALAMVVFYLVLRFLIESQLEVALVHVGFAEILGPSELCSDFPCTRASLTGYW